MSTKDDVRQNTDVQQILELQLEKLCVVDKMVQYNMKIMFVREIHQYARGMIRRNWALVRQCGR
jgi:hypothetical protein